MNADAGIEAAHAAATAEFPVQLLDVDGQMGDAFGMVGAGGWHAGSGKNTYGTGAFLLANVGSQPRLSSAGLTTSVAWRVRGEEHMWTPDAIAKLQHSTRANNWSTYKEYAQLINDQSRRHMTLRGLFEFKVDPARAIAIDEVESAKEIVKRFADEGSSTVASSPEEYRGLIRRDTAKWSDFVQKAGILPE